MLETQRPRYKISALKSFQSSARRESSKKMPTKHCVECFERDGPEPQEEFCGFGGGGGK